MKFKNTTDKVKPAKVDDERHLFKYIKPDEVVDLDAKQGRRLGLKKVNDDKDDSKEESKSKKESKKSKLSKKEFKKELIEIKGIGRKTADDIINVYSKKEDLVNSVNKGKRLPFDSNINEILQNHYKE